MRSVVLEMAHAVIRGQHNAIKIPPGHGWLVDMRSAFTICGVTMTEFSGLDGLYGKLFSSLYPSVPGPLLRALTDSDVVIIRDADVLMPLSNWLKRCLDLPNRRVCAGGQEFPIRATLLFVGYTNAVIDLLDELEEADVGNATLAALGPKCNALSATGNHTGGGRRG